MKGLFKRQPRIPAVPEPGANTAPSDAYGSVHAAYGNGGGMHRDPYGPAPISGKQKGPTDAELLEEYGAGSQAQTTRPSFGTQQEKVKLSKPTTYEPSDPYTQEYGSGFAPMDPEEEEIQSVKYEIRSTKQESLSSTRNALRLARETEETASNTMVKLGEQADTIGDTERHLDIAKAHASRAEDNVREIKQLNKSIFQPKFRRNNRAKREAQEQSAIQRHITERMDRELTREEVVTSQRRVEESVKGTGAFGKLKNRLQGVERSEPLDPKAQRARYQFEATESDDEMEDELDANLDDIAQLSSRMNMLGRAMGQEVDAQNKRLVRVSDKTTALDTRIYAGTQRLASLR